MSVLKQLRLLQGKHIHLDIIRVGGDRFLPGYERDIGFTVYDARQTYAVVGLGIGRVSNLLLTSAKQTACTKSIAATRRRNGA